MKLEHVGIAVTDIEQALKTFSALLEGPPYKSETVESESVTTHFFRAGDIKIELLESLDDDSPVGRFLEKRGEGIHHLAFSVSNLAETRKRLIDLGFDVIGETPKAGADNKRIFFLHPRSTNGVLIECCEDMG